MKKCCFIIPYFGKLPNYFQQFLNSCKYNPDYNWLLFTDDNTKFDFPVNVQKVSMTFSQLKSLFQDKFDFPIELSKPYKLCDYKPAYGYIFQDYLNGYMFWGHCDIDLIFGNISHFITDDMLTNYDKLFCLGHLVLYKNTIENNRVFMSDYHGVQLYKKVFCCPEIMVFDEELRNFNNVNQIFLKEGKKVFMKDYSMNLYIFAKQFIRILFVGLAHGYRNAYMLEVPKKAVYIWQRGILFRLLLEGKDIVKEEYLYIHLQKRRMKINSHNTNSDILQIMPNAFRKLNSIPYNFDEFQKIKKESICFHKARLSYDRYLRRIQNKLHRFFKYLQWKN